MPRSRRRRTSNLGLTLLVIAAVCIGWVLFAFPKEPAGQPPIAQITPTAQSGLSVVVLDVGQGDSLLIRSPAGKTMLIDAGDGKRVAESVILPELRKLGVSRLDYLLLTHPDQDHVGGMPTVLNALPADTAVLSGQVSTNSAYRDWLSLIQRGKVRAVKASRGTMLDMGEGVSVEVLNPPDKLFEQDNENSLILRLVYGQIGFLLMGDAEREAIAAMLDADLNLKSTVLKVGHHGSSNATNSALLGAVDPRYALISVGADNRFGHPHRETLDLLSERGVKVYRTDQRGTITVQTDGESVTVSTTKG